MQQRAGFLEEQGLAQRRGQRVAGIYQRDIMLASGRYAMLDGGMGFSHAVAVGDRAAAGQQFSATVRCGRMSWEIGRQPGPASARASSQMLRLPHGPKSRSIPSRALKIGRWPTA
ncbi:DUF3363 domain-containing protein [Phytopseudomonas dryadis]|uniref:DUF3363 domain-containing protein n=1 Tax=Phytopseudomonas dryadis TaxID=2487520 RepID=UPI001A955DBA|nr:DUF3363 domain-containing protein [Pseudomonas dryadis]